MAQHIIHFPLGPGPAPTPTAVEPPHSVKTLTLALTAMTSELIQATKSEDYDLDMLIELYGRATELRRTACIDPDLGVDHGLRRGVIVLSSKIQALRSHIIVEETRAAWPQPLRR